MNTNSNLIKSKIFNNIQNPPQNDYNFYFALTAAALPLPEATDFPLEMVSVELEPTPKGEVNAFPPLFSKSVFVVFGSSPKLLRPLGMLGPNYKRIVLSQNKRRKSPVTVLLNIKSFSR